MINSIIWHLISLITLYPIDPLYLNNLIDGSDLIVEAEITQDSIYETKDNIYAEAILLIKKVVKGQTNNESIKIKYYPLLFCPEGPTFIVGKDVIAFIKENDGKAKIYGLSYGTKYFATQDLRNQYTQRISEYLKLNEDQIDSLKIVNWLLDNLEYETTSRETTSIISNSLSNQEHLNQGNSKNSLEYNKNAYPITRLWTNEHKSIIREKIMTNELDSRRYSWKLLCHLYTQHDSKFEKLLIEKIPEYLDKENYYAILGILKVLEFKEQNLTQLQQQIIEIAPKRENYQKLKSSIIEFNKLLVK